MRLPIVWPVVRIFLAIVIMAGLLGAATPEAPPPSGPALRTAVRDALTATRNLSQPDAAGVERLTRLYRTLQVDTSVARNQRESLRLAVRSRLKAWEARLQSATAGQDFAGRAPVADRAIQAVLGPKPAQQAAPVLGRQAAPILAQQAAPLGPQQPAAVQQPVDHSRELLEVIQDTISPDSWDVRGGRGVIRYWPPGQALIVRQTGDVHESLGQLLGDLRQ
ncbi:MAG TPA: hypothetical protein VHY20_06060 [Pirellulales bacterium]|nr:hypothetical protein [Pirellulales bacterium]